MENFLGIEGRLAALEQARVVILPVPHDATTSYLAGARHAPKAILRASHHIEEYDEELEREPMEVGIHTCDPVEPHPTDPAETVARVERRCGKLLEQGRFVITLGGDHTVAVGAGRAHAAHFDGVTFLQLDAHADLRDSYEGSPYSHACAARRLSEVGEVVQVGIRSISSEDAAYLRARQSWPITAQRIAEEEGDGWMDEVLERLGPRVYLTFDVDGLDPSLMPATGTPEPGGLGWWQTLRLLRRVGRERRVVGADVCELLPTPGLHCCDVLAARLVYKMVGYFVR
ncbi:MAG: agmatinase [bacterium]